MIAKKRNSSLVIFDRHIRSALESLHNSLDAASSQINEQLREPGEDGGSDGSIARHSHLLDPGGGEKR